MVDYKRIPWPDVVVLAGTQTVTAYSYTCCSILMWVYRNVYEVIILEGILMKCEECKYPNTKHYIKLVDIGDENLEGEIFYVK